MSYNTLLEVSPISNIISIALVAVLLIFIVAEMLQGLRRGFKKQGAHALCTLVAAVFSYFTVKGITQWIIDSLHSDTLGDLLAFLNVGIDPAVAGYLDGASRLLALPIGVIVVPVLFTLIFSVSVAISRVMYHVIKKPLGISKKAERASEKIPGMLIGAVEGFVVFALITLPVANASDIFHNGIEVVRDRDEDAYSEVIGFYDDNIAPITDNVAFETVRLLGGNALLDDLATVEDGGEKINLRGEILPIIDISLSVSSLGEVDFTRLTEEQQKILRTIVDTLDDSDYLSIIVSDILSGSAQAIEDGIIPFTATPPYDKLLNDVVALFSESNKNNLADDLESTLDVYFILCDNGILSALSSGDADALQDAFISKDENGNTIIKKITNTLKENKHTQPLVSTLTEISIAMMAGQIGGGSGGGSTIIINGVEKDTTEVYNDVKDGLKDVLDISKPMYGGDIDEYNAAHEQYMDRMTDSLNTTLTDNGIELEEDIVSGIAEYIDENVAVKDDYSDEELDEIILSYYDVYLEYLETNGSVN